MCLDLTQGGGNNVWLVGLAAAGLMKKGSRRKQVGRVVRIHYGRGGCRHLGKSEPLGGDERGETARRFALLGMVLAAFTVNF